LLLYCSSPSKVFPTKRKNNPRLGKLEEVLFSFSELLVINWEEICGAKPKKMFLENQIDKGPRKTKKR